MFFNGIVLAKPPEDSRPGCSHGSRPDSEWGSHGSAEFRPTDPELVEGLRGDSQRSMKAADSWNRYMQTSWDRFPRIGVVFFLIGLLLAATVARAATILVYNTNDSGAGSLRQAILDNNASAGGNTIVFSNTVTGTITLNAGELLLTKHVTIIGPGPAVLALKANQNRVFNVQDGVTALIANLTVTNGNYLPYGSGGGILNQQSTLTVSNCVVAGNSARNGGGIYNVGGESNSTLTVIASSFIGNTAVFGGAINNAGGNAIATLSVLNSAFIRNTASIDPLSQVGGDGGCIYNDGRAGLSAVTVSNCTFTGNSTEQSGGGIYNVVRGNGNGTVVVNNSAFSSNSAAFYGGGIHVDCVGSLLRRAVLQINNSTFSDNSAGSGGGISEVEGGMTNLVKGCTFNGNSAAYYGGAIWSEGETTISVNASTFSGNSADDSGGAIGNYGVAIFNLASSTFSGNSASNSGGAIFNYDGTMEIKNTLLKAGALGRTITNSNGSVTSPGYNLSSDGGGGVLTNATDQINADPLLGPLTNNGGPTWTHALLPGSPAIDQGKSFGLTTDQRGAPRPYDVSTIANASGGDGSDIGAFELRLVLLNVARSGTNAILSWSTNDPGFTLEYKTSLNNGLNWSNVPGSPALVGGRFTVTNPASSGNKFYRLRSP